MYILRHMYVQQEFIYRKVEKKKLRNPVKIKFT